jgi:aminopeptidase N
MRPFRLALILTLLVASLAAAGPAAAGFSPGSPSGGDPYYPLAGNGGYDVKHYSLTIDWNAATNQMRSSAVITARATQDLSRFDLDLRGFSIPRLTVDGAPASFSRHGQELVITPRNGIREGRTFTVVVDYVGEPSIVVDPDEALEGWVPTEDGAFVVGEPQGSPGWYPVNDAPYDKATFDFTVTVPRGLTVMANGVLVDKDTHGSKTTWVWEEDDLMAPYLATATVGVFDLKISRVGRIPSYVAFDPTLGDASVLKKLPAIVKFYEALYGTYPFNAVGAVADDAPDVGYALETQTKPVFDTMPDETTLAHELAHMWFGDSVTLTTWPDIWLHEGFATWSEWIWSEHTGGDTAHEFFRDLYATPASDLEFWTPPAGNPGGPELLFDGTIYDRGGLTLQALREKIGDAKFFAILREWADRNEYGNVTTPGFIALAEHISHRDLDRFFDVWLYRPEKPRNW